MSILPPNTSFVRSNIAHLRTTAVTLEYLMRDKLDISIDVDITPGYIVNFFEKNKTTCFKVQLHKHYSDHSMFLDCELVNSAIHEENILENITNDIEYQFQDCREYASQSAAYV